MNKETGRRMMNVFFRSFCIQSTWNFWRMQNLGFAFAMIPSIRTLSTDRDIRSRMLVRHLQMFNTNPYMSGPIIGSAMRLEEALCSDGNNPEVDQLKAALMAPYAAIGDSFFWGALRPLAAAVGVLLALKGFFIAFLAPILIFNPFNLWVRLKGLVEGYRRGKEGIEFIRSMDLLGMARQLRWVSVVFLAALALVVSSQTEWPFVQGLDILKRVFLLAVILACLWALKKGVSAVTILYSVSFLLFLVIGLR
ncbi:MAG TPA: PTS system mannose/fructose/sorbose family transporter subunit IID [Syntrophales bacterium]|nr:PTS system mannose/fructose/sorbose family transporter subunit IID [Syntrophales bacterium]